MENFLNDINNKRNLSKHLQPVVLLERSANILNHQSLSHEFYKKGQSSVSNHQLRPYSQSNVTNNDSMVSNQSSTFIPKNFFTDRNQMLLQRHSQEQQTFQHPKLVNENPHYTHNQTRRLNEMQHSNTASQKISHLSDSDRWRCYQRSHNFNDSTFNNHGNNQGVVNDHHFKKPYDVREQSNVHSELMDRFNQLQDSNSYVLKNAPYNIVQSTRTNEEVHASNRARSNTQYVAESQQILEQTDVNNQSTLYTSQGVLDDHHFKRPYDVPFGLMYHNKVQDVKQLNDPNVQYNIVASTVPDQLPQGSMLYSSVNMSATGSYFSVPKFTLEKMKEELLTAISVVNVINSEMEIPIDDLEIHVVTFLMKLRKQIQKLIVNSPSSNASLASLNMPMENLEYIKKWLGSNIGLCGQSNSLRTYQQLPQTLPLNMTNLNHLQKMTEMNKTQQSFAQQPRGNGQNELNQLGESDLYELIHENMDISLFNNTNIAKLRDQSMLRPSAVTTTSTAIPTLKRATKNRPQKMAKQVTMQEPVPVADKNKLGKESLPINNSVIQVSSRGRIIKPKINYWEDDMHMTSTAREKINNLQVKWNSNSSASNLSVPSSVVKKQLGEKTTKALMNESKQTTNKNNKSGFVQKQNTKKDAEKEVAPRKKNYKENLHVDECGVVEKVPAIKSGNPAALEGRKRKNNGNVPVPSKKRKQSGNNLTRNLSELCESCDTSDGSCFECSSFSCKNNIDREIPQRRTRSFFSPLNTTSPSFITGEKEGNAAVKSNTVNVVQNVKKTKGNKHKSTIAKVQIDDPVEELPNQDKQMFRTKLTTSVYHEDSFKSCDDTSDYSD